MRKAMFGLGIVLLMVGGGGSVSAYHIGFENVGSSTLSAGDWTLAVPFLIICETMGDATGTGGTEVDDRNAQPGDARAGNGGLCTTGRNDITMAGGTGSNPTGMTNGCTASRSWPGRGTDSVAASQPGTGCWTELSVCSLTVFGGGGAGCGTANLATIEWDAELAVFACTVPIGFSLYYQELYAYWSYDGDGSYTSNSLGQDGDDGTQDESNSRRDMEGAFQGHVAMFINGASNTNLLQGSSWASVNAPTDDASAPGTDAATGFRLYEGGCGSAPDTPNDTSGAEGGTLGNDEDGNSALGPVSVDRKNN